MPIYTVQKGQNTTRAPQKTSNQPTYRVQKGDNLFKIATKYGTNVPTIQNLNKIDNPNIIKPGQIIKIPTPNKISSPTSNLSTGSSVATSVNQIKQYNGPKQISQKGLDLIKSFEGCVLYTYDDKDTATKKKFIKLGDPVKGKLTIGCGHTGKDVIPGRQISPKEADDLLRKDLQKAENAVKRWIRWDDITQNEFDALVSFTYNAGEGNLKNLLFGDKKNPDIMVRSKDEVSKKLLLYTKSNGEETEGLKNRRIAESDYFKTSVG